MNHTNPVPVPDDRDRSQQLAGFEDLSAHEIIERAAYDVFKDRLCIVSSFGAESVVLLHVLSQVKADVPVLFLNTGKLFGETLRYRDRLQQVLGLTDVRSIAPNAADLAVDDPQGDLWSRDTDRCCHIRKVMPQARAIAGFDALLTGRKRFQTQDRGALKIVERHADGKFRVNPLAKWSLDDLRQHIETHNLPRHPLVKDGYLSIGCMPCTARVASDSDYRSGRWAGQDKEECGIHMNVDGDGI